MSDYRYTLKKFLKDWMLVISMSVGVALYLIYRSIPDIHAAGPILLALCKSLQPVALFLMLFLSFARVDPGNLKPEKWQFILLAVQALSFAACCLLLVWAGKSDSHAAQWIMAYKIPIESFMLCMICPTATACAVVTGKLGGSMAGVISYTVMVNLMVALTVPAFVPLLYPMGGLGFWAAFGKIIAKVFPLLILPCLLAWAVRLWLPGVHAAICKKTEWSFYIWAFALMLAILMSTRAIANSQAGMMVLLLTAAASLGSCILQFWAGKRIGAYYNSKITAGQALGQKNTVFAIWMGYTFLDPVVSVSGGFYSLWHNIFNTWQLYRRRKELEKNEQQ